MHKNCLNLITNEDYIVLKNSDKLYSCDLEYKKYLDSLNNRDLENEWSSNLKILDSLKYTYNFIKSYYYTNIFNFAKYVVNNSLYCKLQEYVISEDNKENLINITKELKKLYEYIDKYTSSIYSYESKGLTYAYTGRISFDENEKCHVDDSREALLKDTYDAAFECASLYYSLNDLYRSFIGNYYVDMLMINPDIVPIENKKRIMTFPKFVLGEKPEDRINYYSTSESIFEITENHCF